MYQFFVEPQQIDRAAHTVTITGSDVNHIKNVLRMKIGEELAVSNGQDGCEYRCGIEAFEEDCVRCRLYFVKEDAVELPVQVTLFQGLPKSDKMEFIIQKAVELGACEIVPVAAKRCVVKLDEKKAAAKVARWQGISEAAAKQSKRGIIPTVREVMSFAQALAYAADMDLCLIPYELAGDRQCTMQDTRALFATLRPGQRVAVFIGPEGGFEESEVEAAQRGGARMITLGKRILRTETAGLVVLSWVGYVTEES
ncbi:MAG: 16S rRNA (uracil(1498)-N(3))-methyltransferase [Lachnospiraceae bacterium]|nr:16S rRNA (uracil(1498)-N(3))-methyltransferase [Lachnospiraceae bacterium]